MDIEVFLKTILVGKRVVGAANDTLTLEDGTTLRLFESEQDCCASAGGDWVINADNLDAVITSVKFEEDSDEGDHYDGSQNTATITVFHNQNLIAQADCYANDGNGGYYYSVLSLAVEADDLDATVRILSA